MHQRFIDQPRIRRSTILGLTLGGVWFAGVSLGLLAARFHGDSVGALALLAGSAELAFADACVVTVLPLFLSAFAVFFFHRFGAFLVCVLRGGCVGFLLGVLTGVGGMWLSLLLLFSGLCYSPVLLWFLWRRLNMGMLRFRADGLCCLLAGVLLSAVDTWVVAPFLVAALSF